jgi:hypothetical protein
MKHEADDFMVFHSLFEFESQRLYESLLVCMLYVHIFKKNLLLSVVNYSSSGQEGLYQLLSFILTKHKISVHSSCMYVLCTMCCVLTSAVPASPMPDSSANSRSNNKSIFSLEFQTQPAVPPSQSQSQIRLPNLNLN